MSKEDMMNKISFALKDPVLQMGFEVICSKLSRLEKENVELRQHIENMYDNHCGNCNRNILNTKLKNRIDVTTEKLIQAKELLNEFLRLHYRPIVDESTLFHKVEQFLRDSDIDGAIQQANEGLNFDKIADEMEQDLKDSEVEKCLL